MVTIAGRVLFDDVIKHFPCLDNKIICPCSHTGQHNKQCYIMCCCSSGSPGQCHSSHGSQHGAQAHSAQLSRAAPGTTGGGCDQCQCDGDQAPGQSHIRGQTGLQPHHSGEGQSSDQCHTCCNEMVRLETSHLWSGVSGVPGLGVSIPRSLSASRPVSSLDAWDSHDHNKHDKISERKTSMQSLRSKDLQQQVGSRSTNGQLSIVSGVKVDIPRVLSPRSSSCRSSGRSTGSRGSSALSQGLSNGSSSSSSKYSNRLCIIISII